MLARRGRENSPRKSAKAAHLNLFHIWRVVSDANYVASSAACSAGWDLKWIRTGCSSGKHARWHERGKEIHTVALKRSTNCGLFAAISHWTLKKKSAFCDRIAIACRLQPHRDLIAIESCSFSLISTSRPGCGCGTKLSRFALTRLSNQMESRRFTSPALYPQPPCTPSPRFLLIQSQSPADGECVDPLH